MLEDRIAEKFRLRLFPLRFRSPRSPHRKTDDDGNELDGDERKLDYLERLVAAGERARWVCAADNIHNGNSILADLRRTVDAGSVWSRFSAGRSGTIRWYRAVHDRLRELGFETQILEELREVAEALEQYATDPATAVRGGSA